MLASARHDLRARLARGGAESALEAASVPLLIVALGVYLSLTTDVFLTQRNIENVLVQSAVLAIVAFGLTFVILAGELDLSVGSVVSLSGVVGAWAIVHAHSVVLGFAAAIAVGAVIGLVNGLLVTLARAPSFIVTLGMLVICAGLANAISNAGLIALPDGAGVLAGDWLGLSRLIWLTLAVFVVLFFVQSETTFGTWVRAVGSNREAARVTGLPVDRVRVGAFMISGTCAGLGGIAVTSRVLAGQPDAGSLLELTAVAAVVVGGTSLFGGSGSIGRTLGGVLLLGVRANGHDLLSVGPDLQNVIVGAVLIAAASTELVRRRMVRRRPVMAAVHPSTGEGESA